MNGGCAQRPAQAIAHPATVGVPPGELTVANAVVVWPGSITDDDEPATEIISAVDSLLQLSDHAREAKGIFDGGTAGDSVADLEMVVASALEAVDEETKETIEVALPSESVCVHTAVSQALRERLTNATEHNDAEEPELSLRAETTTVNGSPWLTISVLDNGPGIPADDRTVLERGEETTLLHSGGLGLWLVNWVVTELGGRVEITDNTPRGTVVTLDVPPAT